jgi:hypothetical protein
MARPVGLNRRECEAPHRLQGRWERGGNAYPACDGKPWPLCRTQESQRYLRYALQKPRSMQENVPLQVPVCEADLTPAHHSIRKYTDRRRPCQSAIPSDALTHDILHGQPSVDYRGDLV